MSPLAREIFRELEATAAALPLIDLAAWYPLLVATGVPTPRTRLIRTDVELISLCDGETPKGFDEFIARLRAAAERLGPPVFLRTGHTSHKHGWRRTCYVADLNEIGRHVAELVEFSAICDPIGRPTDHWGVREFLDLDARFTAFDGMPVAVERRFFIGHGRVLCHHPYWPEEAIADHTDEPEWRARLAETNAVTEAELPTLLPLAERVARVFHGWSVDFARGKDGTWYAIDMATAAQSYHWPDCLASPPHA